MLETARHCFTSAAHCEGDGDEEEWLIHYMLGKVAEKQQQPPTVYLLHYRQAGHYLHEEAARYPKKIHYHNPPELAMEALEVTPQVQGRMWGSVGGSAQPCCLPRLELTVPGTPVAPLVTRLSGFLLTSVKAAWPPFLRVPCLSGENGHSVFISPREQPSSCSLPVLTDTRVQHPELHSHSDLLPVSRRVVTLVPRCR